MTVLIVLILNLGVLSRFLPNDFVKEFVVVDGFVGDFSLNFLSCCGGNSFLYCVGPCAVSGKWVCWLCGDLPGDAW